MTILADHIDLWPTSPFTAQVGREAWAIVPRSMDLVADLLDGLGPDYDRDGPIAVHRTAEVEGGARLKGPLVVGPGCFIAGGSLLRGGCWLDRGCTIGPGAELKSSLLFQGTTLAHFNFVGDSILGAGVNLEAGAIIANYRNEASEPDIRILHRGRIIETGCRKFGALVGDGARIGANAVVAPGAILAPHTVVGRLALVDQRPES